MKNLATLFENGAKKTRAFLSTQKFPDFFKCGIIVFAKPLGNF
jgi:hypothetical protein